MADSKILLLLAVYLVGVWCLLPRRTPDPEEWAAILWPLIAVMLLLLGLWAAPFILAEKARKWWGGRHG